MGTSSMSVKNAHRDRRDLGINFTYKGRSVSITGGINAMGAKKAFILLGLNDLGYRNWSDVEKNFAALIEAIRTKCPDTSIVIQGVFPVTYQFCRERGIKIDHWNAFNDILARVCEEHGAEFFNFGVLFMDENGYMKKIYASGSFHLSAEGDEVWQRALRLYAAHKLEPDAQMPENPLYTPQPTPDPAPTPKAKPRTEPRPTAYGA